MTMKEAILQAREWARLSDKAVGYEEVGQYAKADALTETADAIYQRLKSAGYKAEDVLAAKPQTALSGKDGGR